MRLLLLLLLFNLPDIARQSHIKLTKFLPSLLHQRLILQASNNWCVTFAHVIHLDYNITPF